MKNWGGYIKSMAKIEGKEVLSSVKIRKPRSDKGTHGLRKDYDRAEDELRVVIIKHLRRKGCHVYRIENAIVGKYQRGIPDLWCFCLHTRWGGWIELKTDKGVMLPEQNDFQRRCLLTKVNHLVVRCIADTDVIFQKARRDNTLGEIDFLEIK